MENKEIFIIRREGRVAWFIFNRPEKRNTIKEAIVYGRDCGIKAGLRFGAANQAALVPEKDEE